MENIIKKLMDKNITISLAESCTGGAISSALTKVPGVSKIFKGSFVTYSIEYKNKYLGVDLDTINKYGVVSKEVAIEMASGLNKETNADLCLSITGNCGPSSNDNHEVGLVFSTIIYKNKISTKEYHLSKERVEMINYLVEDAFNRIEKIVEELL